LASEGFEPTSSATVEQAVKRILVLLYCGIEKPTQPITDLTPLSGERNREIYDRYLLGERIVDLAETYRISQQRVYVLIRRYKGLE
jgi:hypothetical protein